MKNTNQNSTVNISDAEWRIMRVLWDSPEGVSMTLGEINRELNSDWSANTVRTLIVRLMDKNTVEADKSSGVYRYSPVLKEEDCVKNEARGVLEKAFRGSASSMFSMLARSGDIPPDEQEKILQLILSMKEDI